MVVKWLNVLYSHGRKEKYLFIIYSVLSPESMNCLESDKFLKIQWKKISAILSVMQMKLTFTLKQETMF